MPEPIDRSTREVIITRRSWRSLRITYPAMKCKRSFRKEPKRQIDEHLRQVPSDVNARGQLIQRSSWFSRFTTNMHLRNCGYRIGVGETKALLQPTVTGAAPVRGSVRRTISHSMRQNRYLKLRVLAVLRVRRSVRKMPSAWTAKKVLRVLETKILRLKKL